jgi:hypothetical protein
MSDLDLLRRLGDQVTPPPFDALRDTARRRDRRTVVTAVVGSGLVVAAVATTTVLAGQDSRTTPQPIEPSAPTTRPLTWAEGSTLHYGNRVIEAEGEVVELDVTDDGVGFRTDDGRIWFAGGSGVEQVGALGETGPGYGDDAWPLLTQPSWMLSANEGSRLVWFEFPAPGEPEVVVYDTADGREVARDPVTLRPGHTALPALVSERYVYWFRDPDPGEMPEDTARVRYDPTTGEQAPVTPRDVYEDLNGDASVRSLRTNGDGGLCGGPCPDLADTDGMNQQMGMDLKKGVAGVDGIAPVGAGDMVTEDVNGRPFRFDDLPGYPTQGNTVAWLVQWLDDRTVVVLNPRRDRTDLIECHLDTHACELAVSRPGPVVAPEFGKSVAIG